MNKQDAQSPMTVEEVANEVISRLDSQSIDQIRHHPSSSDMHFGLGLWIRNTYIHNGKMGPVFMADHVSSEITELIATKALPEYADFPLAVTLFNWYFNAYVSAHRYYIDRDISKMIEVIRTHYKLLENAEKQLESTKLSIDRSSEEYDQIWDAAWEEWSDACDTFVQLVVEELFNDKLIDEIRNNGNKTVSSRLDDLIKLKEYSFEDENLRRSFFVPTEIAFLTDPKLKGSADWEKGKDSLLWLINETISYSDETPLPSWLFDDDEIAFAALEINGNLIQFMGNRRFDASFAIKALHSTWHAYKYIDEKLLEDREVLKAALSCDGGGSVLFEDFFRNYNDDDELVALALDSSGNNLSWASERIRDDFDMVCLAIDNTDYIDNIYEAISERLRKDKRIVARIASRPSVPIEFPPAKYKDDDEIGALLADTKIHGDHFSLVGMSRRIKEKYMTEEELSRWGDIN